MDMMTIAMYVMVGVIMVMMVVKMIKDMTGKKKPKMVEIPRDTNERLEKAYKIAIKGKLNKDRMRHTLWASGDAIIQGYQVGDIIGIQPQNEMYKMHIKEHWWMFWKKAIPIYVDPMICSDLNCKDIIVECRGFEAVTEGLIFPIPVHNTTNLEAIYVGRDNYRLGRVLKQSMDDLSQDADILPKMAMRGDPMSASAEIGQFEEMPELEEKSIRKHQIKQYKNRMKESGGE